MEARKSRALSITEPAQNELKMAPEAAPVARRPSALKVSPQAFIYRPYPVGQNGFNPCCCVSLRTGCIVLGFIKLILGVISILSAALQIYRESKGQVSGLDEMPKDDTSKGAIYSGVVYLLPSGLLIILAALKYISCLALLYAVLEGLGSLLFAAASALFMLAGAVGHGFFCAIAACLHIYFASCGYGLHRQIRQGEYRMATSNAGVIYQAADAATANQMKPRQSIVTFQENTTITA